MKSHRCEEKKRKKSKREAASSSRFFYGLGTRDGKRITLEGENRVARNRVSLLMRLITFARNLFMNFHRLPRSRELNAQQHRAFDGERSVSRFDGEVTSGNISFVSLCFLVFRSLRARRGHRWKFRILMYILFLRERESFSNRTEIKILLYLC